jgi:hypothetical protein
MQDSYKQNIKYDITFAGGEYNSYFFKTDSGIIYEVKFKESFFISLMKAPYFHITLTNLQLRSLTIHSKVVLRLIQGFQ